MTESIAAAPVTVVACPPACTEPSLSPSQRTRPQVQLSIDSRRRQAKREADKIRKESLKEWNERAKRCEARLRQTKRALIKEREYQVKQTRKDEQRKKDHKIYRAIADEAVRKRAERARQSEARQLAAAENQARKASEQEKARLRKSSKATLTLKKGLKAVFSIG